MAKVPSSVIGLDLGRYSLKAVLLQRRGQGRFAVTNFGSYAPEESLQDAETLSRNLKALLKEVGGSAKACAVSVSSPEALLRIIEQPETPTELLREALRLNGMSLLNQDCRSFVLDCDRIPSPPSVSAPGSGPAQYKYLVGGLPRTDVQQVGAAVESAYGSIHAMQLSPVSAFNAFEFAKPDVFANESFFLIDIGHTASTMLVGAKKELMLVRTIDWGGKALLEALTSMSGESRDQAVEALEQEDEVMVEYTRVAISNLTREIGSSIGFFEHRHEQTVSRIFISGGPAKSKTFLKLVREELGIPCESWSALERCEVAVSSSKKDQLAREMIDLNVACGAAAQVLQPR